MIVFLSNKRIKTQKVVRTANLTSDGDKKCRRRNHLLPTHIQLGILGALHIQRIINLRGDFGCQLLQDGVPFVGISHFTEN